MVLWGLLVISYTSDGRTGITSDATYISIVKLQSQVILQHSVRPSSSVHEILCISCFWCIIRFHGISTLKCGFILIFYGHTNSCWTLLIKITFKKINQFRQKLGPFCCQIIVIKAAITMKIYKSIEQIRKNAMKTSPAPSNSQFLKT